MLRICIEPNTFEITSMQDKQNPYIDIQHLVQKKEVEKELEDVIEIKENKSIIVNESLIFVPGPPFQIIPTHEEDELEMRLRKTIEFLFNADIIIEEFIGKHFNLSL